MEDRPLVLLTISQAAKLLKVNDNTLRRWANKGSIEAVCLVSTRKRGKLYIKQEAIHRIWIEGIVEKELERAYEQEWEKNHEYYLECRDWEPVATDEWQDNPTCEFNEIQGKDEGSTLQK